MEVSAQRHAVAALIHWVCPRTRLCGQEQNFFSLARNQPTDCPARSLVTVQQPVHKQLQTTHCAKLANNTQYANMVWARDIVTDKLLFIISVITS